MEDEKISGKKLQGVETKKKILKTAAELFSEYGFEKVSEIGRASCRERV